MAKEYILVIDEGTTSTKAFVFDKEFHVVAKNSIELCIFAEQEPFVLQDADEIYAKSIQACKNAMAEAGIYPEEIACIGITNQRGSCVCWDKLNGAPIQECITWQDTRTAHLSRKIHEDGWAEKISEHMAPPDGMLAILALSWLLKNDNRIKEKYDKNELMFGTLDTWLIYKLTGGKQYLTSSSNASMFHGFDYNRYCWDKEYLAYLGIDAGMLPSVSDDMGLLGTTDPAVFGCAIPIASALADQQAASYAHGTLKPGMIKCTCGTGAFVDMCVGDSFVKTVPGLFPIATYTCGSERCFQLEGTIKTAGATLKWLRDDVGLLQKYSDIDTLASTVHSSGGVLFLPALTGLGAPYWNQDATGSFIGIHRSTNKAHLILAVLEGVAFRIKEVCDLMQRTTAYPIVSMRVDGGMAASDCFCQILANAVGVTVERPPIYEATALGAALAAGTVMGIRPTGKSGCWAEDSAFFAPNPQQQEDLLLRFEKWQVYFMKNNKM